MCPGVKDISCSGKLNEWKSKSLWLCFIRFAHNKPWVFLGYQQVSWGTVAVVYLRHMKPSSEWSGHSVPLRIGALSAWSQCSVDTATFFQSPLPTNLGILGDGGDCSLPTSLEKPAIALATSYLRPPRCRLQVFKPGIIPTWTSFVDLIPGEWWTFSYTRFGRYCFLYL